MRGLSSLFGRKSKSKEKAPAQTQSPWAGGQGRMQNSQLGDDVGQMDLAQPTPSIELDERKPISAEIVMSMPEIQEAMQYPTAKTIYTEASRYEQALKQVKIPSETDPDFMRNVGIANRTALTAFGNYMSILIAITESMNRIAGMTPKERKKNKISIPAEVALGVANACLRIANTLKAQELQMNKIYDDAVSEHRNGDIPLMEGKSYFELFESTTMYQSTGEEKVLGAGSINSVRSVRYGGEDKVIKDGQVHIKGSEEDSLEASVFTALAEKEENLYGYSRARGIKDVNTANRDVAVSRIDKLFGFDVITSTQLAKKTDGGAASLMDKVSGREAKDYISYLPSDLGESSRESFIQETLEDRIMDTEKAAKGYTGADRAIVEKDRDKAIQYLKSGQDVGMDLSDPKIAIQLMRMAVIDRIVGHGDRHAGNYMFEEGADGDRKIKGIDNDTSFPKLKDKVRDLNTIESAFPFIPRELKDKILQVSEADIRNAVTGLIAKPNIEAACQRFLDLQNHVRQLETDGKVKEELTQADAVAYASQDSPFRARLSNATFLRGAVLAAKKVGRGVREQRRMESMERVGFIQRHDHVKRASQQSSTQQEAIVPRNLTSAPNWMEGMDKEKMRQYRGG